MHHFLASCGTIYEILGLVKSEATLIGFQKTVLSQIELAIEEVLVNIISHGYEGRGGNVFIECTAIEPKGIQIIIKDVGIPFNPLDKKLEKERTITASPKDKRIGGWGLYLIHGIMDKVEYTRENDHNVLTLTKYVKGNVGNG